MTLSDLNEDQRLELKQSHLTNKMNKRSEPPSYGELAEADSLMSDSELESEYGGTEFSFDDFFCGVATDRDGTLDEVKAWAERVLRTCVFAHDHPLSSGVNTSTIAGIEWARRRLLDHIEAVR